MSKKNERVRMTAYRVAAIALVALMIFGVVATAIYYINL